MLPAFPDVTTQIEFDSDIDLNDLKSSLLSNKLVMIKWIQTTEKQLKDEIKKTKTKILTESKKESNYVDEILKEKLKMTSSSTSDQQNLSKRCSFLSDDCQFECNRPNLPYSNYCSEHISHNKDQQLFKQCSIKLSTNQQCPNSTLNLSTYVCQKHLNLKKDLIKNGENIENKTSNNQYSKLTAKTKRKYNVKNKCPSTNENKPRKSRKKKDNQLSLIESTNSINLANNSSNNLINNQDATNLQINSLTNNFKSQQSFAFTNSMNSYSNHLNHLNEEANNAPATNFQPNYTPNTITNHGNLIDHHYVPCISSTNHHLTNNNDLSNLNIHSEDSLVAIVNNDEHLSPVPFGESELLSEMLGKIGKIPEDAFNDLFMDNLSSESGDLREIDNVAFNNSTNLDDVNCIEPSISTQAFSTFKNSSNYFTNVPQQNNGLQLTNNNLIYENQHDLNSTNDNLVNQSELICLSNNLISTIPSTADQIKNHETNNFNNTICSINNQLSNQLTNVQQSNSNGSFSSFNVLPYQSTVIHNQSYTNNSPPSYNQTNNNFNSNYLQAVSTNYSSNQSIINGNTSTSTTSNHLLNNDQTTTLLNGSLNGHSNHLLTNNNLSNSLPTTNISIPTINQSYIDCSTSISSIKNETQDKKFNLFTNCTNYPSTYSNIYDDLPSFEQSKRVNDTSSLPSFSIMIKKNRIESR